MTDIRVCAPIDSLVLEIGFWKRASFGSGGVVRMEPIRLSCFALGIREWARLICGKWRDYLKEENTADGEKY